ncbi:MAG: hypothetical protein IPL22_05820 [Bacteroidetes bacterium]|nr:hypothetical protein [Bacteroidota bacterium]
MKKFIVLILFSALYINICVAQDTETQQYKVACVGFYNLENLFDTEDDTTINDEEWLPTSSKLYTQEVYQDKLRNLSHILSLLGKRRYPGWNRSTGRGGSGKSQGIRRSLCNA